MKDSPIRSQHLNELLSLKSPWIHRKEWPFQLVFLGYSACLHAQTQVILGCLGLVQGCVQGGCAAEPDGIPWAPPDLGALLTSRTKLHTAEVFFLQIIMKKEVSENKWSLVHLARAALGCGNSALGAVTPEHVFACAPSSALRRVISDFHRISVSMNYCFKTLFFSQVGICQDFLIYAFFWHFLAVVIT